MAYTPMYCEARHPKSPNGCYELYGHKYQHRGYPEGHGAAAFYWEDEPEPAPAEPGGLVLNRAELTVILTAMQPVQQFFPDLMTKLNTELQEVAQ